MSVVNVKDINSTAKLIAEIAVELNEHGVGGNGQVWGKDNMRDRVERAAWGVLFAQLMAERQR